jgi:hypothetical protein
MTPRRYGPLAYVPMTRRPQLTWPDSALVALWVNPNIEFFGLDDGFTSETQRSQWTPRWREPDSNPWSHRWVWASLRQRTRRK